MGGSDQQGVSRSGSPQGRGRSHPGFTQFSCCSVSKWFVKSYSLPSQIDSGSLRIDEQVSAKTSIFFRFGDTPSASGSRYLSNLTEVHLASQTYTLGLTSQLTTSVANDFHLGYSRSNSAQSTTLDSFGGAVPTNLANSSGLAAYAGAAATFEVFIPGIGLTYANTNETRNKMRQWNETNVLSLAYGKHQFKFGADFRQIKSPLEPVSRFQSFCCRFLRDKSCIDVAVQGAALLRSYHWLSD